MTGMLRRFLLGLLLIFGFGVLVYAGELPELRGVWIDVRSIPGDEAGVRHMVERLSRAHFNALFVESFYRGETIYPSEFLESTGLPAQMEHFRRLGFDPLRVFVEEAHRRNMQVHAWFHMFYVGLDAPGPILSAFPQWAARNRDGSSGYTQGGKRFFFVCPLHEGVLEFYKGLLGEVVERYDLDGVHFDYFRFPDPTIADTCYCEACRQAFRKVKGFDPLALDPVENFEVYREWVAFRAEGLSDFAASLSAHLRRLRPELLLSCAVKPFGFPLEGYPGFLQDWPTWGRKGIFDFLVPMTYSSRPQEFEGMLRFVRTFLRGVPFCAGIWCMGMDVATVLEEIQRAKRHTPCGIVLFAYPYLGDDLLAALSRDAFATFSPPPGKEDFPHLVFSPLDPQDFLEKRRTIRAKRVDEPCVVDGVLEELWQEADWQGGFSLIVGGKPSRDTKVAVLYDEECLYVAYVLEGEPQKGKITQRDGPVFYDDSVELFLDPWASRSFFFQFAANLIGTQYDGSSFLGARFDGTWQVGVAEVMGATVVEMAIPFKTLGRGTPRVGECFGVNFCRNDLTQGEFSTWTEMPGIYGASFFFGTLEFGP